MPNYIIEHGSIAAVMHCNKIPMVYFNDTELPGRFTPGDKAWTELPTVVQTVVQKRFKTIFEQSYENWSVFMEGLGIVEIDVNV